MIDGLISGFQRADIASLRPRGRDFHELLAEVNNLNVAPIFVSLKGEEHNVQNESPHC